MEFVQIIIKLLTVLCTPLILGTMYVLSKIYTYKSVSYPKNMKKTTRYTVNSYFNLPYEDSTYCKHSVNKQRFHKKRVPEEIDAIVIGSGIGGLSSAAFLARSGYKVLVLEQHYIAGGCTHCYSDMGVEFDTGIHYVGNIEKRKQILDLISETPIKWDKMGREDGRFTYDEIYIGNDKYEFRAGQEEMISELLKHFPDTDRDTLNRYFDRIKKTSQKDSFFNLKIAKPKWLVNILSKYICADFYDSINKTAYDVVSEYTDNEQLKAVLCSQFGDSGPTPKNNTFFMHASIVNHYMNGGWYPRGGTSSIAKAIIPVIEKAGGRVLVNAKVDKILLDENNKTVIGVRLVKDGLVIHAPKVISATGIIATAHHLLPDECKYRQQLISRVNNIGPSCTYVYLFLKLNGSPSELKLRSSNIWSWPNEDYDKMLEDFYNDPENAPIPMFAGFPCAKDSEWEHTYPGVSNAVILTAVKYEWFEKWKDHKHKKRGGEYMKFKDIFKQRLINEICRYYPQLDGKIMYADVGSPLTFNHYIGSTFGECYGLDCTSKRFVSDDWLRPATEINGLYLSGQDITTLGFTGALMSGVLTAHEIMGYGTLLDIIKGRNLINDIMYMDSKSRGE